MDARLFELLRNIIDELDDLRHDVDRGDSVEDESAVGRHIERDILFQALTEDGE